MFRFLLLALYIALAAAFMAPMMPTKITQSKIVMDAEATRDGTPGAFNIDDYDGVWSFEAKKAVFDLWDPSKPRDYTNFNPFERNDEAQMCDTNGCFPGQSRGYKAPVRPDVDWAEQTRINQEMDKLKTDPKFSISGQPGNFKLNWQDNLGPPP